MGEKTNPKDADRATGLYLVNSQIVQYKTTSQLAVSAHEHTLTRHAHVDEGSTKAKILTAA